jgi:hypothetical protein
MEYIKRNWIYILFGLSVVFFVYRKYIYHPHNQIRVTTFQTPQGWGYDIKINDSIFIHQNLIPGIEGNKGFAKQNDAAKVGNLVLYKMKNRQMPLVTLKELDSLQIER